MAGREHLILSATERDRPGLVAELTRFIAARGCNVEDSRVAVLGGYAGLMFLLSGEPAQVAAVVRGVRELERDSGLRALVRRIEEEVPAEPPVAPTTYAISASAMDHQGLIFAITDAVRAHGGNILELETSVESAPMTGAPLFALQMTITLAERHGSVERLREVLAAMAQAEAMDLTLDEAVGSEVGSGSSGGA